MQISDITVGRYIVKEKREYSDPYKSSPFVEIRVIEVAPSKYYIKVSNSNKDVTWYSIQDFDSKYEVVDKLLDMPPAPIDNAKK